MKRYIKETNMLPIVVNIDVIADHPILDPNYTVAASEHLPKNPLPSGPVISKDRNRITQRMIDDFESFMDNIEWLCEETYGLIGTYKNVSEDHSHYYNYLAADEDGNIIVKFRLRLRISNHKAKRTEQQQRNKKEETESARLKELLTDEQIKKLRSYAKLITVNDEEYSSYEDAFDDIDNIVGDAVEVMTRRKK